MLELPHPSLRLPLTDDMPEIGDTIREILQTPGAGINAGGLRGEAIEDLHTVVAWIETHDLSGLITVKVKQQADGQLSVYIRCEQNG